MSEGFSIIPHWVIRDTDLSAHELLVYLALLNRADRYGKCWPSMKVLTREARCSERTVKRTLEALGRRGLVQVVRRPREHGPHLPNVYRVAIFDRERPSEGGGVQRAPQRGARSPGEGRSVRPEVDTEEVDTGEVDLRSDLHAAPTRPGFAFPDSQPGRASRDQRTHLRDLWIHLHGEPPNVETQVWIDSLTGTAASAEITGMLREMPRWDDYQGPEPGTDAYEQLSERGQQWADQQMLPA